MRALHVVIGLSTCACGEVTSAETDGPSCGGELQGWDQQANGNSALAIASNSRSDEIAVVTQSYAEGAWLTKLTVAGHELWRRSVPGAKNVAYGRDGEIFVTGRFAVSLELDSVVLTANDYDAAFVARLDTDGAVRWATKISEDGGNLNGSCLVPVSNGDVVALGHYLRTVPSEPHDSYQAGFAIVRFDGSGNELWRKSLTDLSVDAWVLGMAVDPTGDIVFGGGVREGKIDLGGEAISGRPSNGAFVVKLGADGSYRWSRTFPELIHRIDDVTADSAGSIYVVGKRSKQNPEQGTEPYLMKLAPDGSIQWNTALPIESHDDRMRVASRPCGGVFATANDYYIASIIQTTATDGTISIHQLPRPGYVKSIAVDRHDALFLSGNRQVPPPQAFVSRWIPRPDGQ